MITTFKFNISSPYFLYYRYDNEKNTTTRVEIDIDIDRVSVELFPFKLSVVDVFNEGCYYEYVAVKDSEFIQKFKMAIKQLNEQTL